MPLTIGIKDGLEKGFTKEELQVTNGFEFGLVCMHAGVGKLGDSGWGTVISCDEAVERFTLVLEITPLWNKDSFPYKWITNVHNMKRLETNDWYCNVSNETAEHFMHKMKETQFDKMLRERDDKFKFLHNRTGKSYNEIREQRNAVIGTVGCILEGWTDELEYSMERLVDAFDLWDMEYNNKYLHYDEDACKYMLTKVKQED